MTKLLIVAGEASGDLHGAHLARALYRRLPDAALYGVGGPLMRQAGVDVLHDVTEHAAVGFVEASAALPRLIAVYRSMVRRLKRDRPAAVILIDHPEFNLRFARHAHRLGVPVIYYISPQVWAWRTWRVRQVARYVSEMLVIFPFEQDFYERHGVRAIFVGHPLLDMLGEVPSREQARADLKLPAGRPIIGLLPGSRLSELDRLFPIMLAAAERLRRELKDVQFVLGCGPAISAERVSPHLKGEPGDLLEVHNDSYRVMRASDLLLVASGTATVEAAILNVPMVVTYKVARLTWTLFSRLMKVENYAMVNIIAGRRVVPELIQRDATPERLAQEALALFRNGRLDQMRQDLRSVVAQFGPPGATERAADEIVRVVSEK